MVSQPQRDLAEPYDLLESQEDLWWDAKNDDREGRSWRVLINVQLQGYILIPKGSRALCLGFAHDMEIPEIEGGMFSFTRMRSPYLLIEGFPYFYMPIGWEHPFDRVFRVVSRLGDADPPSDS